MVRILKPLSGPQFIKKNKYLTVNIVSNSIFYLAYPKMDLFSPLKRKSFEALTFTSHQEACTTTLLYSWYNEYWYMVVHRNGIQ